MQVHVASKMWIWWPSKVSTLKLEYSTLRFLAKYDIFLQNWMDRKIVSKRLQQILVNLH